MAARSPVMYLHLNGRKGIGAEATNQVNRTKTNRAARGRGIIVATMIRHDQRGQTARRRRDHPRSARDAGVRVARQALGPDRDDSRLQRRVSRRDRSSTSRCRRFRRHSARRSAACSGSPARTRCLLAALTLVGGAAGDRFGRRRLFRWGTAILAGGSVACGAATTPAQLIAGRAIQGLGAALLVPNSLALLSALVSEGRARPGDRHLVGVDRAHRRRRADSRRLAGRHRRRGEPDSWSIVPFTLVALGGGVLARARAADAAQARRGRLVRRYSRDHRAGRNRLCHHRLRDASGADRPYVPASRPPSESSA